jgi:CDP-glycerol glycerophosphotransferase
LHADFYEEFVLKHPYLASQFAAYPEFDSLVSVSKRMSDVNRTKLSARFRLEPRRFHHCVNMVDEEALASRAKEPLDADFEAWLEPGATFVTLGRLSPEKDHAKLINAFARVAARCPAARLLVLGEGPLRAALQQQIAQLGLEQSVYLAGLRSNPFPLLNRCDCFVLSSNHEGQPMVLLEAMVLGKPIVATDIDGNRGVLKDGYGHLVDNSVTGLERGMLDFLGGKLTFTRFDAAAYRKDALGMFDDVIGRGARTVPAD